MTTKKIAIITICLCFVLSGCSDKEEFESVNYGTFSENNKDFQNINQKIDEQRKSVFEESVKEKGLPSNYDEVIDGSSIVICDSATLNNEQKKQIDELHKEAEKYPAGVFCRQEKIILGEIQADSPKIDLDIATKIITTNKTFSDILFEFEKIQKYPDLIWGSGMTFYEYWLDENGDKKIVFNIEWEGISLKTHSDGKSEYNVEVLFNN